MRTWFLLMMIVIIFLVGVEFIAVIWWDTALFRTISRWWFFQRKEFCFWPSVWCLNLSMPLIILQVLLSYYHVKTGIWDRFGIGKWQRCYSFGTPICFTVYEKICLWFLGSFENPMFAYLRSGFPFVFPIEKTFTSKRITGLMFRSVGSLCCKQFENFLWKWHADLVYPSIDITVFQLLDLIFSFLFFPFFL